MIGHTNNQGHRLIPRASTACILYRALQLMGTTTTLGCPDRRPTLARVAGGGREASANSTAALTVAAALFFAASSSSCPRARERRKRVADGKNKRETLGQEEEGNTQTMAAEARSTLRPFARRGSSMKNSNGTENEEKIKKDKNTKQQDRETS